MVAGDGGGAVTLPETQTLILRIATEPISSREIREKLKLSDATVTHHIRALRDKKLLYIDDWLHGKTQMVPLYRVGDKPDVQKPTPLSKIPKSQRHKKQGLHVVVVKSASPWDALTRKV